MLSRLQQKLIPMYMAIVATINLKFLLLIFFFQFSASAQVWKSQNKWNEQWEQKYAEYVANEVSTGWVQKQDSIAYGYLLDCARFIYFVRLQFAMQNKLPFNYTDLESKKVISNETFKVEQKISEAQKVRLFTNALFRATSTFSLAKDTFLVPLERKFFIPGLILLGDFKKQHSWLLKKLSPSFVPTFIFSTLPNSDLLYETYVFPTEEMAFVGKKSPTLEEGGFRQFLWPQEYRGKSRAKTDQSKIPYRLYFETIQAKMRSQARDENEEFDYMLEDICVKMRIRANVIIDTEHFKRAILPRVLSEKENESYSTDSRDSDIQNTFQRIDNFYSLNYVKISQFLHQKYETLILPRYLKNDFCYVQWAENKIEPLGVLRRRFLKYEISSNANDSYAKRWGDWR